MQRYLAPILVAWVVAGCANGQEAAPHHAHDAAPELEAPSGLSVYQLGSVWTDQHGRTRTLNDLHGRPRLIAMVYTNCGTACPRIVLDMKKIEATFDDVDFTLVSIDPERDTPGRLAEFAQGTNLGERYSLLAGEEESLLELAAVLGIRYRRVSETEFLHSNVIVLLDAAGAIAHRQEGFGDVDGMIAAIARLSE